MPVVSDESDSGQPSSILPLAQISTAWSTVLKARGGDRINQEEMTRFFARYQGAVLRYFRTAVRNQDVAEDLTQDFALKFIRGGFQAAHPAGGRF